MKEFCAFLTAACLLGIAQCLSAVAWAALLILLLMSAVVRPRVTFSFIASLGLLTMAVQRPAAMVAAFGAIGVAVAASRSKRRRPLASPVRRQLLLYSDKHR